MGEVVQGVPGLVEKAGLEGSEVGARGWRWEKEAAGRGWGWGQAARRLWQGRHRDCQQRKVGWLLAGAIAEGTRQRRALASKLHVTNFQLHALQQTYPNHPPVQTCASRRR